jgi:hypothetical protein
MHLKSCKTTPLTFNLYIVGKMAIFPSLFDEPPLSQNCMNNSFGQSLAVHLFKISAKF